MRCRACGGLVVIDPQGYYVCSQCGLVVEYTMDSKTIYLSTATKNASSSLPGREHFRKIEQLELVVSDREENRIWKLLGKVAHEFSFSESTRERILEEYKRLVRRYSIKKKTALIAFLTYIEIRRRNQKASARWVVDVFRRHGMKLRLGDLMQVYPIARQAGLVRDDWSSELETFLAKVKEMFPGVAIEGHVSKIITKIRPLVGGRSRKNVVAAVIVLVLRKLGINRDLYFFSKVFQVPYSSLRANVRLLESLFLEVGLEEYLSYFPVAEYARNSA